MKPRFLVVVFDALRPDMVTPETVPNLAAFAAAACAYPNSRAVFPSETRVNTASFATGAYPGGHGIVANCFFDPRLSGGEPFNTAVQESLARADHAYGADLVSVPALGDVLHAAGLRFAAVSSGTPGNARFINPRATRLRQPTFSVHGPAASSTPSLYADVTARCGPVPEAAIPNIGRVTYAAEALLGYMLPVVEPDVAVVWFSEPDISYHYRGIGSTESLAGLRAADDAFGRILDWRERQPDRERIQVIALSDHGQIATEEPLDLVAEMQRAGFPVATAIGPDADLACVPAYSGNVFARDGDPRHLAKLVAWMQEQPWCGLLFTPEGAGAGGIDGALPGTFAAALIRGGHARAPQLSFTLRADDMPNAYGFPGRCVFADRLPQGGGVHGGAHARELNNFLALQGHLFPPGRRTSVCDLTSLAPTILHCLGMAPPPTMTGRVLTEALDRRRTAGAERDDRGGCRWLSAGAGDHAGGEFGLSRWRLAGVDRVPLRKRCSAINVQAVGSTAYSRTAADVP